MIKYFLSFFLCTAATVCFSQTVATFTPVTDNTIYSEDAGLSNGAGATFIVGRTGGNMGTMSRRALLKFNLSSIPQGSAISSVSLKLVCEQVTTGAASNTVELHKCLEDWGEGASNGQGQGAPAEAGDATWKCRFSNGGASCSSTWSSQGGTFSLPVSASKNITTAGDYTFSGTQTMINDVKLWVDNPSSNFGWVLKGNETTLKTSRGFTSREGNATATVLTVTYTASTVCSGANKWTGSVSNSWEVAGNWSCGKIPDAETDVEIDDGVVVISSNAACRSIKINPGASIKINDGFNMTVAH